MIPTQNGKLKLIMKSDITLTLKKGSVPPISLSNQIIPPASNVRYLLKINTRQMPNLGIPCQTKKAITERQAKSSKLSLKNKLLLYKSLLKPIWSYGIQLWGAAKNLIFIKYNLFNLPLYELSQQHPSMSQITHYI